MVAGMAAPAYADVYYIGDGNITITKDESGTYVKHSGNDTATKDNDGKIVIKGGKRSEDTPAPGGGSSEGTTPAKSPAKSMSATPPSEDSENNDMVYLGDTKGSGEENKNQTNNNTTTGGEENKNQPSSTTGGEVSVFYYTFGDTYISSVRSAMDKLLKNAGVNYQNYDANGNQTTQTEQVTTAIAKGSRALIVNVVDTGSDDAAQNIVDMAKAKNIPVIFFNRSVTESVVTSYDKCVFVGTDYEMAGHMQGELIGNYVLENYDKLDLNKDGKISYVMFKV